MAETIAHVGAPGPVLADALELVVLQEAEELGLEARGDLRDLVEEQGAAVGGLDPAGLVLDRAGEGAAGVPEELAGQQVLAQRRAVDDDEGPRRRGRCARGGRAPARTCRSRSRRGAAPPRLRDRTGTRISAGKEPVGDEVIKNQILFTRDYQDIRIHLPTWQNAGDVILKNCSGIHGERLRS